jgi:predicted lipid-binding transport protein (Tim44 family)
MSQTLEAPASPRPAPEAAPAGPAAAAPFRADETAAFHDEDWHAAAAISGIMVTILSAGLIGYVFIALWVLAWPM